MNNKHTVSGKVIEFKDKNGNKLRMIDNSLTEEDIKFLEHGIDIDIYELSKLVEQIIRLKSALNNTDKEELLNDFLFNVQSY